MLMIETSTLFNQLNCEQSNQHALETQELQSNDLTFYNTIRGQLDNLKKNRPMKLSQKFLLTPEGCNLNFKAATFRQLFLLPRFG